jgi:hypothetical protein
MVEWPRRLRQPGAWFWAALALGAMLRVYLFYFTEGTFDVAIKLLHGDQINRVGLLEYYRQGPIFNHPPLMGEFFAAAVRLAAATGVPFGAVLRAPFALLDLGTALLLLRAFSSSPWRYAVLAAYWLHPLSLLFSAYHGNTDPALACLALLSLLLACRGRALAAGAALGLGLWVKLPVLVAAPALCLAFPSWKDRLRFSLAAALVGTAGYLPALAMEPRLVVERVVGYGGSGVTTPSGVPIWGLAHTLRIAGSDAARLLEAHNTLVCWVPILLLAWLRRGELEARALGASVCGAFLVLYGFTSFWAWQYLAWSIPFWFFLDWRLTALLTLVVGSYVSGAYAFFTGSPWLQGRWDFAASASWPAALLAARDASVMLCAGISCWMLATSWLRRRRSAPEAEA